MDASQISILIALILYFILLPIIGLYMMFRKAGKPGWYALIPGLNTWFMLDTAKKPMWWFFMQFIPGLGVIFTIMIYIEFVKCFGKFKFYQHALTVVASPLYFFYIGFNQKDKYTGPEAAKNYKKSVIREWVDAGLFAIIAATVIRTFLVEAYTIPTPSMEGSLLVNDYLFVSKFSYGPRVPMTPLAVPLVHNVMPLTGGKSYTEAVEWGYHRLPGLGKVDRNDVVVFNFPDGDSVIAEMPENDYYTECRASGREAVLSRFHVFSRPVDKTDNYIKRCVGIPGDVLEVRDAKLYVNGKPGEVFPHAQSTYLIRTKDNKQIYSDVFDDNNIEILEQGPGYYLVFLENDQVDLIRQQPQCFSVTPYNDPKGFISKDPRGIVFPADTVNFKWNKDNYGPFTIPKKGTTVALTPQNIAMYRRLIDVYEGNDFEEKNGQFIINGKPATSYTFKMDYYWMMGDNRHNSLDSRYWGFVPEDHVVGKAWFVWLSYSHDGIRWKRLFRSIHLLEK